MVQLTTLLNQIGLVVLLTGPFRQAESQRNKFSLLNSSQRHHHNHCISTKVKLEEAWNYHFESRFQDSHNHSADEYFRNMNKHADYSCNNRDLISNFQYVNKQNQEYFSASTFLERLMGRTMLVIGDSLGEQLYQHLIMELVDFLVPHESREGNGTHTHFSCTNGNKSQPDIPLYPKMNAAVRVYYFPPYPNASVLFCKDAMPSPWLGRDVDLYCTRPMIQKANIVLFAFGAHFKPPDNAINLALYKDSVEQNAASLELYLGKIHEYLRAQKLFPKLIWRLDSHTGPIDEYNAIYYRFGGRNYNSAVTTHANTRSTGYIHDVHQNRSSTWVRLFNGLKRAAARENLGYVLDHYSMSMQMLQHESDRILTMAMDANRSEDNEWMLNNRIRIHADSLHYCAGGLFRAGNLLLSDVIAHVNRCSSSHSSSRGELL